MDTALSARAPQEEPMAFSAVESVPVGDVPPTQMMMMSKMSLTTVPSTTPQNVGELVALLSLEADGDFDLGVSDLDDPLFNFDPTADQITQSYDVQTI